MISVTVSSDFFIALFSTNGCSHHLYSPRWLLKQEVPKIVKSINRLLREKSIKTKVGIFYVLMDINAF